MKKKLLQQEGISIENDKVNNLSQVIYKFQHDEIIV